MNRDTAFFYLSEMTKLPLDAKRETQGFGLGGDNPSVSVGVHYSADKKQVTALALELAEDAVGGTSQNQIWLVLNTRGKRGRFRASICMNGGVYYGKHGKTVELLPVLQRLQTLATSGQLPPRKAGY